MMSYRNPEQSIEEPARSLIGDIDNFSFAVDARIEAGDWKGEHLQELISLVSELIPLKYKLLQLAKETW